MDMCPLMTMVISALPQCRKGTDYQVYWDGEFLGLDDWFDLATASDLTVNIYAIIFTENHMYRKVLSKT